MSGKLFLLKPNKLYSQISQASLFAFRSNGHQGKIIPSGCIGKFTKGTLSPQKDKHTSPEKLHFGNPFQLLASKMKGELC